VNTKTCKTWCFDFEIRVKWWSIGPPPIDSLFLSSAPSPGYQQQQKQRKQPKNNIEILGQKWYRLYNVWFKAHNRTLIYQSHTKLFYVQYHIIRQNMTYMCVLQIRATYSKLKFKKDLPISLLWEQNEIIPRLRSSENLSHYLLTLLRMDWVCFSQVTASICKIQCKELKYANVFRVFSIFAKYLWNLSRL